MTKACLAFAFFCLGAVFPLQAFQWETVTAGGREYVTLRSFCIFYNFQYAAPSGNNYFQARSPQHSIHFKVGSSDAYLDDVHYVLSFPIENGDHDWLVSRMDVIKLFEPLLRPSEISARHSIRGFVIDAGHGGTDNGATSRLGAEKDYTLKTAVVLEKILRDQGFKTVLTRRSDVFVDLYERAHIASLYPDYAFISIHYNSATPEARGLETYCLSPRGAASTSSAYLTRSDIQKLPGNDYDPLNILLASMVHSEIIKLNPGDSTADRGVKRARFVVIKQNVLPAILVEGGFVSNRMEAAEINTSGYRQRLAEAIARGAIRFANVMGGKKMPIPASISEDNPPEPPPAPPKKIAQASSSPAHNSPAVKTPVSKNGDKTESAHSAAKSSGSDSTASTAPAKTKKSKGKKSAVASNDAAPSPAPTASTSSTPLNLADPAPPTPSPGADKAAPEPDEPPVVNIYSTTPIPSSSASDPPPVSTSPPAPRPPKTDAGNSPAPSSTENP